jgi:hypothetical protein
MEIGIINDAINGIPLFVSSDSRIQFITKDAVVNIVKNFAFSGAKNKVLNMGGIGAIEISDIENIIGCPLIYQDNVLKRHYEMDVH